MLAYRISDSKKKRGYMKKLKSILALREALEISQSELARQTKIPQSSISNWEAGNWYYSMASFKKLRKYANKYGYDLDFIC
jgi:transcriptional regulator with XRE-family HTH domain